MFELKDIDHRYGGTRVLAVDQWSVAAGEHWLVAGPSGSGKTTLLHILAGLTVPTAGRVAVGGVDLASLRGAALDRWRGRSVGLVPQRLHLVGALDVLDNLRLARYLAGLPDDPARARGLLEAMGVGGPRARGCRGSCRRGRRSASPSPARSSTVRRCCSPTSRRPTSTTRTRRRRSTSCARRREAVGATLVVASHDARVHALLPREYALPRRTVDAREPRDARLRLRPAAAAGDVAQRAAARRRRRDDHAGAARRRRARGADAARRRGHRPRRRRQGHRRCQIVLAGVYHADVPPGNIPLAAVEELAREPAGAAR